MAAKTRKRIVLTIANIQNIICVCENTIEHPSTTYAHHF